MLTPQEGLQRQFLLRASEAGRGVTSCQCLQGDRPSATPSPAPRHRSEPMETFTALVLFPDRPLTKVRVIPLVKEELGSDSLDDNVPGIHGAGAAHQCGQNGVGGKHIPLGFCQLQKGHERGVRTYSGLPFTPRGEDSSVRSLQSHTHT